LLRVEIAGRAPHFRHFLGEPVGSLLAELIAKLV